MTDADGTSLPVTMIETETHVGVVIADRVVVFGKGRDRTRNEVEFSFTGFGSFEITVADLEAGTWNVTRDGISLSPVAVRQEGGVARFDGQAGSYKLTIK